jgi:hypothetical protein
LAYVRHKIIKGRKYFYLVEGYRVDAKVRQRVLLYLGASEPSEKVKQQLKKQYSKPKKTNLGADAASYTEFRILPVSKNEQPYLKVCWLYI